MNNKLETREEFIRTSKVGTIRNIREIVDLKTGELPYRYTSPGAYGLTYIGNFDDILCVNCSNQWNAEGIAENVVGGFLHLEGTPLTCETCNCAIESEYGVDMWIPTKSDSRNPHPYRRILTADGRLIYITTENGIYYADVVEKNGDEHGLCQAHSRYKFEQELEACGVIGA